MSADSTTLPSVVIIEDNADTNNLLQDWLRQRFNVTGFLDAESAERLLKPSDEKVVFLIDYNLPGENGIEIKKKLAELFPNGKYILISGLFDYKLTEKAKAEGFDALLPKPFSMQTMTQKVELLFGLSGTVNVE
jgi:DNA-binding NtrC family response regulator